MQKLVLESAKKIVPEFPTPGQMKNFAKGYPDKWDMLCADKEFLNVFTENLDEAARVAERILKVNK
jgi:hypothetical protein